jgi:hypothetical protein
MKKKMQPIVLFDYDGTLSGKDAKREFFKYCLRKSLRANMFLPAIGLAIALAFVSNMWNKIFHAEPRVTRLDIFWRELLFSFLTANMVRKYTGDFVKQHRPNQFGWAADQIAKEKAAGNFVIITSAGSDYLILPLVSNLGADLIICSVTNKKHPWKFDFFNYGVNKVMAVQSLLDAGAHVVRSYSDSKSDLPMMQVAAEQVWIDPQTGCRR